MADPILNLSLVISRESPLADLELNDHTTYSVIIPPRSGVTHDNVVAESEHQDGELLLSSRKIAATIPITIRVDGADWPAHSVAMQALVAAFEQRDYTLTEVKEGVQTVWTKCQPADVAPREAVDPAYTPSAYTTKRGRSEYVITLRCHPRPTITEVP